MPLQAKDDARLRLTAPRRSRDAEGDWKQVRASDTKSEDVLMDGGQGHQPESGWTCLRLQRSQGGDTSA